MPNPQRDNALGLTPDDTPQDPDFRRQRPYQIGALVSMVGSGAGLVLGVMALLSGREGDGAAMIAVGLVMGAASVLLFSLAGRKK
jgi:hypothetical protein